MFITGISHYLKNIFRYNFYAAECTHFSCTPWVLKTVCTPAPPLKFTYRTSPTAGGSTFLSSRSCPPLAVGKPWSGFCFHRLLWPILEFHINGIMVYVLFFSWLLLLNIMFLDVSLLLHISVFPFIAECSSLVSIDHILLIHLFVNGCLYFQVVD